MTRLVQRGDLLGGKKEVPEALQPFLSRSEDIQFFSVHLFLPELCLDESGRIGVLATI